MWERTLVTTTTLGPEALWQTLTDFERWPQWQAEVAQARAWAPAPGRAGIEIHGRDGRRTWSRIEESLPGRCLCLSHVGVLSGVRTRYEFEALKGATLVRVSVRHSGLLSLALRSARGARWDDHLAGLVRHLLAETRLRETGPGCVGAAHGCDGLARDSALAG